MSNEYLVVLPVKPIGVGSSYDAREPLPAHCTVMHWFRIGEYLTLEKLRTKLEEIAQDQDDIELVSDMSKLFGKDTTIPVHVLKENGQLRALHGKIHSLFDSEGCLPQEPDWIGKGYRPHVTDTSEYVFSPGTSITPHYLVLIKRNVLKQKLVVMSEPIGMKF